MEKRNNVQPSNPDVHCPFNYHHKMPLSRLPYHISFDCKDKREKGHLYKLCPFNSVHYVLIEAYDNHLRRCPDKTEIDNR